MPWLLREEEVDSPEQALLLIHIPRTGGTQLYSEYKTFAKSREGHWPVSRFFLGWLQYRHTLYEGGNFPMCTLENLWFGCIMLPLGLLLMAGGYVIEGVWVACWATFSCIFFTFLATPPGSRMTLMRRIVLTMSGCTKAYSSEYMYGLDCFFYPAMLLHMTASEMIAYDTLSREQLMRVCSFSFVRSPYRRMVSLFLYNRWGKLESFETFVRRWHDHYKEMREQGLWDLPRERCDWDMYCHRLPMHVYTHQDGEQLVRYVLRLEDKQLIFGEKTKDGQLPPAIKEVLERMSAIGKQEPETPCVTLCGATGRNARPLDRPWQEYYTPEIAALVHEMYQKDFELFGYDPATPVHVPKPGAGDVEAANAKTSTQKQIFANEKKESTPLLAQPLMGKE